MSYRITPYLPTHEAQVLALSMRAWAPVFQGMEPGLPAYVYGSFYPEGWEARQTAEQIASARIRPRDPGHDVITVRSTPATCPESAATFAPLSRYTPPGVHRVHD